MRYKFFPVLILLLLLIVTVPHHTGGETDMTNYAFGQVRNGYDGFGQYGTQSLPEIIPLGLQSVNGEVNYIIDETGIDPTDENDILEIVFKFTLDVVPDDSSGFFYFKHEVDDNNWFEYYVTVHSCCGLRITQMRTKAAGTTSNFISPTEVYYPYEVGESYYGKVRLDRNTAEVTVSFSDDNISYTVTGTGTFDQNPTGVMDDWLVGLTAGLSGGDQVTLQWIDTEEPYGEGLEDNNGVYGINDDAPVRSIQFNSSIGGSGICHILVNDPELENLTTYIEDIGNIMMITDQQYSRIIFGGEVVSVEPLDDKTVRYTCQDMARKLLKQPTNTNPVLYSGTVRHLEENKILDDDAEFDTDWGTNGYYVTIEQDDPVTLTLAPRSYSYLLSGTNNDIEGDSDNLYFNDGTKTTANQLKVGCEAAVDNLYYVDLNYYVWVKQGTELSGAVISVTWGVTTDNSFDSYPEIGLYNAETDHYGKQENFPTGLDMSVITGPEMYTTEFVLTDTIDDFLADESESNDSDFDKYLFKVRIKLGDASTSSQVTNIHVFKAVMEFTADANQSPGLSIGQLDDSTTATLLNFDNSTPSWALAEFPLSDGFGIDDIFYITKSLDEILDDCFDNSESTDTLDHDITGIDELTWTKDLTHTTLYDIIQPVTNNLSALWWREPSDSTIYARSVDNLGSTGITLTESDIIRGLAGVQYSTDGSNLRNKVTVIGRTLSDTQTVTISGGITLGGGETEEIYIDDNITSRKQLDDAMTNYLIIHGNPVKEITISLDLTDPNQNYSAIKKGLTIALTLGSGSIANFTDGNDGELLIHGMNYVNENEREILTLILQRRYS